MCTTFGIDPFVMAAVRVQGQQKQWKGRNKTITFVVAWKFLYILCDEREREKSVSGSKSMFIENELYTLQNITFFFHSRWVQSCVWCVSLCIDFYMCVCVYLCVSVCVFLWVCMCPCTWWHQFIFFFFRSLQFNDNNLANWDDLRQFESLKKLETVYFERNPLWFDSSDSRKPDPSYRRKVKLAIPWIQQIDATLTG